MIFEAEAFGRASIVVKLIVIPARWLTARTRRGSSAARLPEMPSVRYLIASSRPSASEIHLAVDFNTVCVAVRPCRAEQRELRTFLGLREQR